MTPRVSAFISVLTATPKHYQWLLLLLMCWKWHCSPKAKAGSRSIRSTFRIIFKTELLESLPLACEDPTLRITGLARRSWNNFQGLALSCYLVGLGDRTQIIKLGSNHLSPLNHLTSSAITGIPQLEMLRTISISNLQITDHLTRLILVSLLI